MRSMKNVSMICLAAMVVLLAFAALPASAADGLPEHSIYIGNTAVSIDYLMDSPVEAQALVNQLISEQGLGLDDLWYQITGEPVKNIGTGADATSEEISEISAALEFWYDADGVKHAITTTYTVTFTVTDVAEAAIENATVTFGGVEMQTSETGVAVFEDVAADEYVYMVSMEGYISQDGTVTVVDADVAVPITLEEEPVLTYDVTFSVTDVAEAAIADATVSFNEEEKLTNDDGYAVFEDVVADEYDYAVSKEGYISQDGTVTVDEDVTVPITLAEVEDPVVTTVVATTEGVPASDAGATIEFEAFDQYGEAIVIDAASMADTAVEAEINGMALIDGEDFDYTVGNDFVEITTALNENDLLVIDLVKDETTLGTFSYTVTEAEERVATTFTMTADKATMPAGETATFTITVKDQFGNSMAVGADAIRWTLKKDGSIVAGYPTDDGAEKAFTLNTPGDYTVQAVLKAKSTLQETLSLSVGAAELTELTVTFSDVDGYNLEAIKSDAVTANEGAALSPEDLKFNVSEIPDTAEISLSAAYNDDDEIIITVVTDTTGTYKFDTYVGESYDAEDAVKAGVVTITTEANPAVDSVVVEEVEENELTEDGYVFKEVWFYNKYDEELSVNKAAISTVKSDNIASVVLYTETDGEPDAVAGDDDPVKFIKITANDDTAGEDASVTVASNGKLDSTEFTIAAKAAVKTITIDSSVEVIEKDNYAYDQEGDRTDVFVAGGKAYIALPVDFTSQFGNALNLGAADVDVTSGADVETQKLYYDDEAEAYKVVGDESVEAIGVYAGGDENLELTVGIDEASEYYNAGITPEATVITVSLNDKGVRAVDSFTLSATALDLVTSAESTITVTKKDQYNDLISVDVALVSVTSGDTDVATVSNIEGSTEETTFKVTAVGAGETDVTVKIVDGETELVGPQTITVDVSGLGSIASIAITDKAELEAGLHYVNNGATEDRYDIDLSVTAYDASGNVLSITDEQIQSTTVTVYDGDGAVVGDAVITGEPAEGVTEFTLEMANAGNANLPSEGTVVVEFLTANGKSDTVTLEISDATPEAQAGTVKFYMDEISEANLIGDELTLTDVDAEILTQATDQYGVLIDWDMGVEVEDVMFALNPADTTVVVEDGIYDFGQYAVLKAQLEGETPVFILYNEDGATVTKEVAVTVTAEAAEDALAWEKFVLGVGTELTVTDEGANTVNAVVEFPDEISVVLGDYNVDVEILSSESFPVGTQITITDGVTTGTTTLDTATDEIWLSEFTADPDEKVKKITDQAGEDYDWDFSVVLPDGTPAITTDFDTSIIISEDEPVFTTGDTIKEASLDGVVFV